MWSNVFDEHKKRHLRLEVANNQLDTKPKKKFKQNQAQEAIRKQIEISLESLWGALEENSQNSWPQMGESFRCITLNLASLAELHHGKKHDVVTFFTTTLKDVLSCAIPKV